MRIVTQVVLYRYIELLNMILLYIGVSRNLYRLDVCRMCIKKKLNSCGKLSLSLSVSLEKIHENAEPHPKISILLCRY